MKTLVKSKIVLEDNNKTLITYMWKKTFLCFGYWYPFGSSCSNVKISEKKLNKITDENVSEVLFNNFIKY